MTWLRAKTKKLSSSWLSIITSLNSSSFSISLTSTQTQFFFCSQKALNSSTVRSFFPCESPKAFRLVIIVSNSFGHVHGLVTCSKSSLSSLLETSTLFTLFTKVAQTSVLGEKSCWPQGQPWPGRAWWALSSLISRSKTCWSYSLSNRSRVSMLAGKELQTQSVQNLLHGDTPGKLNGCYNSLRLSVFYLVILLHISSSLFNSFV